MKDLLEQVMPEFAPVPDRVEQVRRRMRVARDRRLTAGAAAAVLVVAAGAMVMAAERPSEQPAVAAAAAVCDLARGLPHIVLTPPLVSLDAAKVTPPIVPVDAAKVTMCVYEDLFVDQPPEPADPGTPGTPHRGGKLLGTKVQLDADGTIGRKVNAMPKSGACATPSGSYLLVFEYENRTPVVVRLHGRCGQPIPREELLGGGDVLGWLDRLGDPYRVAELGKPK